MFITEALAATGALITKVVASDANSFLIKILQFLL